MGSLRCPEYLYTGLFVDGIREGDGRCVFANGSTYDGQWSGDAFHGRGSFRAAPAEEVASSPAARRKSGCTKADDGNVVPAEQYDGEWKCGQRDGQGDISLPSKDSYSGGWFQGRKHGKGVFSFWDD